MAKIINFIKLTILRKTLKVAVSFPERVDMQ